jgi:hypothetical protein
VIKMAKCSECFENFKPDVCSNCLKKIHNICGCKFNDELVLLKEQLSKAKGDIHIIEQCMAFKNFSYPCMNTDCSFGKRKVCPLRFNGSFENLFGEKI